MARPRIPVPVGTRFGALTITGEVDAVHRFYGGGTVRLMVVRCDCGNERQVRLMNLRSGNTLSCGCHAHRPKAQTAAWATLGAA